MNPEDYKKMLGKYIKALILPKFPEINDFIVQSQSRSDGKEGGYAYIIFYNMYTYIMNIKKIYENEAFGLRERELGLTLWVNRCLESQTVDIGA